MKFFTHLVFVLLFSIPAVMPNRTIAWFQSFFASPPSSVTSAFPDVVDVMSFPHQALVVSLSFASASALLESLPAVCCTQCTPFVSSCAASSAATCTVVLFVPLLV